MKNSNHRNLDIAQALAKSKGGQCLTKFDQAKNEKFIWRCKKGHEWSASLSNVEGNRSKVGTWCPYCSGVRLQESWIDRLNKIAKGKRGQCLSKVCRNQKEKVKLRCEHGHEWKAKASHIYNGSWCPDCSKTKRDSLKTFIQIARKNGGACLSSSYINQGSFLKFRCKEGHEWKALGSNIKKGSWCPRCSGNLKLSISHVKKIANERGGVCLSKTYLGVHKKYDFKCSDGHFFSASYRLIFRGSWCPSCSENVGEKITRMYFERVFGMKFKKSHPEWLRDKVGDPWELDGLGEKSYGGMRIAFEHHGVQHYKRISHFHRKEGDFLLQKSKDKKRREKCHEQGIALFEIPQLMMLTKLEKLPALVEEIYKKYPFIGKKPDFYQSINFNEAYKTTKAKELKDIISSRGGVLLGTVIKKDKVFHRVSCDQGHAWEVVSSSIKVGTWCPYCAGRKKERSWFEHYRSFALAKGGDCLSKPSEYKSARHHLLWICSERHQWKAVPYSIGKGNWCPTCRKKEVAYSQRDNIENMHKLAKKNGGECLSREYFNNSQRLSWQCNKGHKWLAVPSSIKRGSWCKVCAQDSVRISNYEMYLKVASNLGFSCLTKVSEYKGSRQLLKLKCSKGHKWNVSGSWLKKARGCPVCRLSSKSKI